MIHALPTCTLRRDADTVRDGDAWDLAREIVELARREGFPVLLSIEPNGGASFALLTDPSQIADRMNRAPMSIVGVYTEMATAEDIHDDIIEMPRGWECDT